MQVSSETVSGLCLLEKLEDLMLRTLRELSLFLMAASVGLIGCSDGGGSSGALGAQTGEVYLLLADAPDVEYTYYALLALGHLSL